jgi:hypothetical protein
MYLKLHWEGLKIYSIGFKNFNFKLFSLLSVRVNALICIGKLLQHLDKWLVMDEILPMLQQIPSREPAVIMAIIGKIKLYVTLDRLKMVFLYFGIIYVV